MEDSNSKTIKLVANIKQELRGLITEINSRILQLNDPYAEALFQVSAEEIDRLERAFSDYEKNTIEKTKKKYSGEDLFYSTISTNCSSIKTSK